MGGNALAQYGARRYSAKEYRPLADRILETLRNTATYPWSNWEEIPSYRNKPSFGDMDILCYPLTTPDFNKIIEVLGSGPRIKNSNVLSILVEELQVDIIQIDKKYYHSALNYYSYNDLGNLLGKLLHKFGLKFGHRGLMYPMRDGDNQYDELYITDSILSVLEFLGLDKEVFIFGDFFELEDIFKYVMSSKYYSAEPFQYENLNHTNRIRDKKRNTYKGFLQYIKDHPKEVNYQFKTDKREYLPLLFETFPTMEAEYQTSRAKLDYRLKIKAHFNGEKVQSWTGLTGELLGQFMATLKKKRGEFSSWVLEYTEDELKHICLQHLKEINA